MTTTAAIIEREDAWQVPTYAKLPLALVRGEGSYVFDADGKRYLDMYGGHCVALVGHGHPRLVEAIERQARRLVFYSNAVYSDVRAEAAEKVATLAPAGLRRVFFCNSGAEANEVALKIARKHTGRRRVVSMAEGFHGRTLGALGATGIAKFRDPAWPIPTDHRYVSYGDVDALAGAMDDTVAAVLLEPIPSMGGVAVAEDAYFAELRSLCDRHGALLMFDEVQTGLGRTGTHFFGEQVGLRPDLITAAKGLAGGFPAGAVFVREDIAASMTVGEQGTTFGGGPLACAAMAAVADVLREEDLAARAADLGAWLAQRLAEIPGVRAVHGRGLLIGADLEASPKEVSAALREGGYLVGGGAPGQMRLLPPLTLTRAEVEPFVTTLEEILS